MIGSVLSSMKFHGVSEYSERCPGGGIASIELQTPQGTEILECDMVIVAIGQGARGEVNLPRDHPKVFTGGDCANGGAEIVNAAAEGVAAAKRIHEMLRGRKDG